MNFQQTIRTEVSLSGIGLHSGMPVRVTLLPAAAYTGILFRGGDGTFIPANLEHLIDSRSATTLGAFGVKVRTVEHLLAAVSALGIDNLLVDIDGEEVPAADGSARPFVELLERAGRVTLPAPRQAALVLEPLRVGDGHRWLEIRPAPSFRVSYTLDSHHPAIGLQMASVTVTERSFVEEIAPARTYGFLKDVPLMRQTGLAGGGSLDNAIVVGKRLVLNDSLRFADEFVRHKILDLVGDLALLGRPVAGHVVGHNAGHALNHELVAAIQTSGAADRRRHAPRARTGPAGRPEAAPRQDFVPGIAAG